MATSKSEPVCVAFRSNHNTEFATGLHAFCRSVYRGADGAFFLSEEGGPSVQVARKPRPLSREEAVLWVATYARDPVTGYGYTREQAEAKCDGRDAGDGRRECDDWDNWWC